MLKRENFDRAKENINQWSAFRKGDQSAYEHIFKAHYGLLVNYGLKLNHDRESVRDTVHTLMSNLWENRKKFGDSVHHNVKLLSNFKQKCDISAGKGVIKCVLWHQGERNANADDIPFYMQALIDLFVKFRNLTNRDDLPIIIGELGRFAEPPEKQSFFNEINDIIHSVALEDPHSYYITSEGLTDKGDNLHFDARSQRELGLRFAQKYVQSVL